MNTLEQSPLGRRASYPDQHDADLLFALPRAQGRAELAPGLAEAFRGCDIWHAWELSWLDASGKPRNAVARLVFDAHSPNLIESKSLKLYLMSFALTRFASTASLVAQLRAELGAASGSPVAVSLLDAGDAQGLALAPLAGQCIDEEPVAIEHYDPPRPDLLATDDGEAAETLVSHLFRSNCPITGQPDWASVQVRYRGPRIERAGLLRYLVSFRRHGGFHEQCVERIFGDILARCAPQELAVYACFTRRGGLDINPWRSTTQDRPAQIARDPRQ